MIQSTRKALGYHPLHPSLGSDGSRQERFETDLNLIANLPAPEAARQIHPVRHQVAHTHLAQGDRPSPVRGWDCTRRETARGAG